MINKEPIDIDAMSDSDWLFPVVFVDNSFNKRN
jgi:hypothetical protein